MGSRAVEDLAVSDGVTSVTIADRNAAASARLAESLRGKGAAIDVKAVDADDHAGLVEAMRGCDVAASALGPFFLYEPKLVDAAVEAGVNYCSICDEWGPAEAVMDRFHDRARAKGVTVITGLGASPGLTNLTACYLAGRLDRARSVEISIYLPLDCGGGIAALRHGLHIMTEETAVWRNGERVMMRACSEERTVEFPRFGNIRTWNMGHSEPATLPRFIDGLDRVDFFMGFGQGASLVVRLARSGLFNGKRRAEVIVRVVDALERLTSGPEPSPGAMRVDVCGEKDGESTHLMSCGTGGMREITGLALSVGALMLGERKLTVKGGGVYPPEGCLDAATFLAHLAERGIQGYEDLEMARPTLPQ